MGSCIQQGDLFYSAGLHRNHVLATSNTGKLRRGLEKNTGEWTGRVETSKEEIPSSKHRMYGCSLSYSRLERENASSVFSPEDTLISVSTAPHCGEVKQGMAGDGRLGQESGN